MRAYTINQVSMILSQDTDPVRYHRMAGKLIPSFPKGLHGRQALYTMDDIVRYLENYASDFHKLAPVVLSEDGWITTRAAVEILGLSRGSPQNRKLMSETLRWKVREEVGGMGARMYLLEDVLRLYKYRKEDQARRDRAARDAYARKYAEYIERLRKLKETKPYKVGPIIRKEREIQKVRYQMQKCLEAVTKAQQRSVIASRREVEILAARKAAGLLPENQGQRLLKASENTLQILAKEPKIY